MKREKRSSIIIIMTNHSFGMDYLSAHWLMEKLELWLPESVGDLRSHQSGPESDTRESSEGTIYDER